MRERSFTWSDPAVVARAGHEMGGLEVLQQVLDGVLPGPPIAAALGFELVSVDKGRVEFALEPAEFHYNPIGSVHGGFFATLLDSASGCAVHSMLDPGIGYTSLDLHVKFLRQVTVDTGRLSCVGTVTHLGRRTALAEARMTDRDGKLLATAVSSCLILQP